MEVLQRTANRGSISTGFDIDNSLKLERANSENLYRQIINGNRKTWMDSLWIKRTNVSASAYQMIINHGIYGNGTYLRFLTDDTLQTGIEHSGGIVNQTTSQVFRDTSAWMHIVWRVDTTQATGADRSRLYINGEQVTSFSQDQTITQNTDTFCNYDHSGYDDEQFGYKEASLFTSMYYADIYHVDGQSLAPTEFGEVDSASGIWKPIEADISSFGNNGYYLNFSNSSNLGEDTAGNGSFTLSNIAAADQAVDTPTNNFAMLSSAMHDAYEQSYSTISEGGTKFRVTTASKWVTAVSSIGVTKGKWYAEFVVSGARPNNWWGIASMEQLNNNSGYSNAGSHLGESGKNWSIGYYQANGKLDKQQNSGYTSTSSWGAGVGQNQVVGVALDMDNHKLYMAVNNTYQDSGNPVTAANPITFDATETVAIATTGYSLGGGNDTITIANFGGYKSGGMYSQATDENGLGAFRYAPPSGYYALCTKNLAEYG